MAGTTKLKIIGSRRDLTLDDYGFLNFLYTEDINLGFPTLELSVRDNLFTALQEDLYGDEEILIEEFKSSAFKFTNKSFKIKSIGSAGVSPRPASAQTVKLVAIDKNYDALLKNETSIYFSPNDIKKVSDLIIKLLANVGITNSAGDSQLSGFDVNIVPTAPIVDEGFQNLFIPYNRDIMKVVRKLCNYAVTVDGVGSFVFFINKKGLYFVPISSLFKPTTEDSPHLLITDGTDRYGIRSVKLSPFNAFSNFIMGHEKRIMGFNLLEKDYNIIRYAPNAKYREYYNYEEGQELQSNLTTMPLSEVGNSNSIPFAKDFLKGHTKTYFTPLDNVLMLKGFADKLYYSQMFNYVLEVELDVVSNMPNFNIGEMVLVEFKTTDVNKWSEVNGGWLLKSFAYGYPGDSVVLKLVRIGSAQLPDTHFVRLGE